MERTKRATSQVLNISGRSPSLGSKEDSLGTEEDSLGTKEGDDVGAEVENQTERTKTNIPRKKEGERDILPGWSTVKKNKNAKQIF